MLFDKLFKKKDNVNITNTNAVPVEKKEPSTPQFNYVQNKNNRNKSFEVEYDVLVLWWISKKKKGYDRSTNSFPKWFEQNYNIDFNQVMLLYINQGYLSCDENIVKITEQGVFLLKELDYVIYVYEHAQYALTLDDFKSSINLRKDNLSDIVWNVFKRRLQIYAQKGMWENLAANYGNMADLLIGEKQYSESLDYIFGAAYIETSGMRNNNELTPVFATMEKSGWKKKYLKNGMPDVFMLEINNYYVTKPFIETQKNLNLDWGVIKKQFLNSRQINYLETIIPFRYFEKEESFEIFKEAIQAGGKKGIFPLSDVSKKLKSNIPDENSKSYFYASTQNLVNRQMRH